MLPVSEIRSGTCLPMSRTASVVCDMYAVTFLGTTRLGVLVEVAAQSTEQNVELLVVVDDECQTGRSLRRSVLDRSVAMYRCDLLGDQAQSLVAILRPMSTLARTDASLGFFERIFRDNDRYLLRTSAH